MKPRNEKYFLSALGLMFVLITTAQKKYEKVAFLNGTVHVGDGKVIEGALLVINKDKIETVTSTINIKINRNSFDTIIDMSGKHIYPGLINTNNVLGLHDAEAVRATRDFAEVGALNPHVRSLIAYNTDNLIVPTVKTNGILFTQVTPRGGMIPGSSSIMKLEGWNWEDALLKADDGIHLNFPRMVLRKYDEDEDVVTKNPNKKYLDEIKILTQFFADAQAYCNSKTNAEKNIRFEAMRNVLNGNANLYLHADKVKDIICAINFAKQFNIKKPVIVGGKESYRITADLKKDRIPVMLNRVNDLPDNTDDDIDIVYRTPYLLQKDSVLFCIQMEGDMEAPQSRNLSFNAGAACAYGLTKEQALSAISYNAARILGIDKDYGTLEDGKQASFIISTGDILDMRGNNVILAYISGKKVDLNNRQTELYLRYKNKYGIK